MRTLTCENNRIENKQPPLPRNPPPRPPPAPPEKPTSPTSTSSQSTSSPTTSTPTKSTSTTKPATSSSPTTKPRATKQRAILPSSDSKLLQDDTLVIKSGGLKEGSERCNRARQACEETIRQKQPREAKNTLSRSES
ncbi:hypothetical protein Peur_004218 [Populus x canadensis]